MELNGRKPIIAVGDLVWDVLTKPDAALLPGGDTTGQVKLAPGGSAANVAAWIARVGMSAGFVGAVGADVLGDLIVADLEREGVGCHIVRSATHDTGVVLVLIDLAGQRSMVTNQGADFHLLPDQLPAEALRAGAHVHLTGWSMFTDPPRAAVMEAARIARAAGATISFDPASHQMIREMGVETFGAITAELAPDLIFPNRDEGMALTGEAEPQMIARALRRRYPGTTVVLKLDRDGCFVVADGHERQYEAVDAEVLDTTGAGDSFNGAFLARYTATGDLAAAATFANVIAAWNIARSGARPPVDDALRNVLGASRQGSA